MLLQNLKIITMENNNLISVAKILNFHGIKGEVKAGYTKGKDSQIASIKKMYVKVDEEFNELNIVSVRFHKSFALIKFKELESINDVEPLKGLHLYIDKEIVESFLEEDEFLISDLDGIEVYDKDENYVGRVTDVGENSATNIIGIIDENQKVHLIPFVKELVPIVDLKNRRIIINKIEGLIE